MIMEVSRDEPEEENGNSDILVKEIELVIL
jgi:hypothetical protein